jgi:hypothetical protein
MNTSTPSDFTQASGTEDAVSPTLELVVGTAVALAVALASGAGADAAESQPDTASTINRAAARDMLGFCNVAALRASSAFRCSASS